MRQWAPAEGMRFVPVGWHESHTFAMLDRTPTAVSHPSRPSLYPCPHFGADLH